LLEQISDSTKNLSSAAAAAFDNDSVSGSVTRCHLEGQTVVSDVTVRLGTVGRQRINVTELEVEETAPANVNEHGVEEEEGDGEGREETEASNSVGYHNDVRAHTTSPDEQWPSHWHTADVEADVNSTDVIDQVPDEQSPSSHDVEADVNSTDVIDQVPDEQSPSSHDEEADVNSTDVVDQVPDEQLPSSHDEATSNSGPVSKDVNNTETSPEVNRSRSADYNQSIAADDLNQCSSTLLTTAGQFPDQETTAAPLSDRTTLRHNAVQREADHVTRHGPPPSENHTSSVDEKLVWRSAEVRGCRGVSFLKDGQLVTTTDVAYTSDNGAPLRVFDRHGTVVRRLTGSLLTRPWASCYCAELDSLAVTDLDSTAVKIVKSSLSIRDLSIWRPAGVTQPTAIALNQRRQSLYVVTDSSPSSSSRVSLHARHSAGRFVKLHSFTDELIEESTVEFVAVDGQDRIIVSDSDGGRVLVYSVEGQRLVEFSSCGGPDGRDKMRPQGLAVDGSGNILVADQTCSGGGGGGRVLKFSPDGLLVDVVCEWNGQSERPWGVAYDETERRLAVASDSGLSVYRL
jgi:hypothetical protein